jgi:hypothetical protein
MTWVKFDDMLCVHPKILDLSHEAFRLYVSAAMWSNLHLTEGSLPAGAAENIAACVGITDQAVLIEPVIAELVASGCWTAIETGGYHIAADPNGHGDFWAIVRQVQGDGQ